MANQPTNLAALLGTYRHGDGCTYRVHVYQQQLHMARTRPGQPEGSAYPVEPAAVRRLLDFNLFVKEAAV